MKDYLLFGPEKWSFFFLEHTQSWSGEVTEFWLRPSFFWRSPDFGRKIASNWFKTEENLGQVRLLLFSPLKKAPFAKSWLRAWHV